MRLEHGGAIVAVEPSLCDRDGRKAGFDEWRDEVHLALRVARVPLGLYIDATRDLPAGAVRAVVLDEIAPPQRAVVAVAERDRLRIAEPGVIVRLRIPDVQMGVRNRERQSAASVLASKKC